MPAEIIITSVPRGLDGGSGFQTVKRTREMSLAVSERLHQRSGYTHRFAAGDKRNPVIISHQIEKLKAGVFHVLGLIKDAGTDHSGRQNRLAHLIAFDETDVYGNQAGPASVAKQLRDSRLLIDSWDQQPHEAEPLAIPSFNAEPGICQAWIDAGLDPGVAGELAEAAATGKKSVLIVPASTDVIALFADAMLLMPPGTRWKTTFTTCGSGSEDYVWQAVRADLVEANDARKLPGVIDLTQAYSGKDSPYASFAKTGKGQLPWQQSVPDVPDVETDSAPPIGSQVPPSSTQVTPPLHSQEVTNASGSTTAPQLDSSNAMQSQGSQPKKRKLSELSSVPAKVPSTSVQTNFLRNAALVVASSLFLALIVLAAINVQVISAYTTKAYEGFVKQSTKKEPSAEGKKVDAPFTVPSEADVMAQRTQTKEKEDIEKRDAEWRKEQNAMSVAYKKRLKELTKDVNENTKRAEEEALSRQQKEAFQQFEDLPKAVSLCSGIQLEEQITQTPVLIGQLQWNELKNPKISLATPKNFRASFKQASSDFEASDGMQIIGEITVEGASVDGKSDRVLARIFLKSIEEDDESDALWVQPTKEFKQNTNDGQNLLRSLLLITATDPESRGVKPCSIQFFKPEGGQGTEVNIFSRRNLTELSMRIPKELSVVHATDSLTFNIKVVAPCDESGKDKKKVYEHVFDTNGFPIVDKPREFVLIEQQKRLPGTPYLCRCTLQYYTKEDKQNFFIKYKYEKKQPKGLSEWFEDPTPIFRSKFTGLFEKDKEKFKTNTEDLFKYVDGKLDGTQFKFATWARKSFDGLVTSIASVCDKQSNTGWMAGYWAEAKKENDEKKKEQEEDEKKGVKYRIELRYQQPGEWVSALGNEYLKAANKNQRPDKAEKIFKNELDGMKEYFKRWYTNFSEYMRQQYMPLVKSPPRFFIERVETAAYGIDDKEYPVVLIDQDAQPPEDHSSNDGKPASLN